MADYITIAEGDAFAIAHLDGSAWGRATSARKTAAIAQATREVDAERYQGQKYNLSQDRQFPRLVDGTIQQYPGAVGLTQTGVVWDWDSANNAAIVPPDVKRAVFEQSLYLLRGDARDGRLQAIADGVIGQAAGSVSEEYRPDARPCPLCRNAETLLKRFRLRSGRII